MDYHRSTGSDRTNLIRFRTTTDYVRVPLLPRSFRWLGVLVLAAFIFYTSLVTVPETVVDDAQPQFLELNH